MARNPHFAVSPYAREKDGGMPAHHGFTVMIGLAPGPQFATEHPRDEDDLDLEPRHDVSQHGDDGELHLPQFHSKAEIAKHIACLEHELAYFRALLSGDDGAADRARGELFDVMSDGESDE